MGLGGKEEINVGNAGSFLTAIDPRTGTVTWRRKYPSLTGSGGGGGGPPGGVDTARPARAHETTLTSALRTHANSLQHPASRTTPALGAVGIVCTADRLLRHC